MLTSIVGYVASVATKIWAKILLLSSLSWVFCQTRFDDIVSRYSDLSPTQDLYLLYPAIILLLIVLPTFRQGKNTDQLYVVPAPAQPPPEPII